MLFCASAESSVRTLAFSKALADLDKDYIIYKRAVDEFRPELSWRNIASQHGQLYRQTVKVKAEAVIPA